MKKNIKFILALALAAALLFAGCAKEKTIAALIKEDYQLLKEAADKKEIQSVSLDGPEGVYSIDYPEVYADLLEGLEKTGVDAGTKAPSAENGTAEILTFTYRDGKTLSLLFFEGAFCLDGQKYVLSDADDLRLAMQDIVRFGNEQ